MSRILIKKPIAKKYALQKWWGMLNSVIKNSSLRSNF